MHDLIDRQMAIDILDAYQVMVENGEENPYTWARFRMSELPSAQPERTGRWIHDGSKWANRWICDRCKYKLFGVKTKFCPDCGAKMEVEHGE